MTDVMRATVNYKRIHTIVEKKCKKILPEELKKKCINKVGDEILKELFEHNKSLRYMLKMEKERHDNLMLVAMTRYEEDTRGPWKPFMNFRAAMKISLEFLYAWFFKK